MIELIVKVVTLIFFVLAEQESKKMWSKFDNVTPVLGIDFRQIDQNLRKLVPQRIIFSKIGIFKVMF